MVKDFLTVNEVARILSIYEVSARELLDGIIPFEAEEVFELSQATGIAVNTLLEGEPVEDGQIGEENTEGEPAGMQPSVT